MINAMSDEDVVTAVVTRRTALALRITFGSCYFDRAKGLKELYRHLLNIVDGDFDDPFEFKRDGPEIRLEE